MANTASITLSNILALTTAAYWTMGPEEYDETMRVWGAAPGIRRLKEGGYYNISDTFKTGMNLYTQSVGNSTFGTDLTVEATQETFNIPTEASWDFFRITKSFFLPKNQLVLLETSFTPLLKQMRKNKKLTSTQRRNALKLVDGFMNDHVRKMLSDLEYCYWRKAGITGTSPLAANAKCWYDVLDPASGPSSNFEGLDFSSLEKNQNVPLYVTEGGGTGSTDWGITLTGDATIDYAKALKWITALQFVQESRGRAPYTEIWMNPTAALKFAGLAEDQVYWTAPIDKQLMRTTLKKTESGGINLQSQATNFTINGLKVYMSPAITADHILLTNPDAMYMELFHDDVSMKEYYGNKYPQWKEKEALFRVYADKNAYTVPGRMPGDASIWLNSFLQFAPTCPSKFASVQFTSSSTT